MSTEASKAKLARCPICKSAQVAAYKPFCSKRCADIDLGKWFTNSYTIPGSAEDDEADKAAKSIQVEDEDAS